MKTSFIASLSLVSALFSLSASAGEIISAVAYDKQIELFSGLSDSTTTACYTGSTDPCELARAEEKRWQDLESSGSGEVSMDIQSCTAKKGVMNVSYTFHIRSFDAPNTLTIAPCEKSY
jgi:hypothetical protein